MVSRPVFGSVVGAKWGPVIGDFKVFVQERFRELVLAGMEERWGHAFYPAFNSGPNDISSTYVWWQRLWPLRGRRQGWR